LLDAAEHDKQFDIDSLMPDVADVQLSSKIFSEEPEEDMTESAESAYGEVDQSEPFVLDKLEASTAAKDLELQS
jgi:hypothetical protein